MKIIFISSLLFLSINFYASEQLSNNFYEIVKEDSISSGDIHLLFSHPSFDVNKQDDDGDTLLQVACCENNKAAVKSLLQHPNIDVNTQEYTNKYTPLHSALLVESFQTAEILLARDDIDVNRQDVDGDTPLHVACYENNISTVKFLLQDPRIDVNIQENDEKCTALHRAAFMGYFEIVQLLIARDDIDVNIQNFQLATALHLAVDNKHKEIVRILLNQTSINTAIEDCSGKIASYYATDDILGLFLRYNFYKQQRTLHMEKNKI